MKKLILAAAVIFGSVAFTACTKENVQPTHKATTVSGTPDKGDLGQADGDKGDLGQADGSGNGGGTVNP